MNASVEWLSAFVESGLSPEQLRDLLTARVATVDAVEPVRADLTPIIVGRVVSAERLPDSDHLWATKVDVGGAEPLEVICGAPNVTAGLKYPFAPVGTVMPSGVAIERRKIRGRASNGMLCSARELGLGDDEEGILALDTGVAPGTPLLAALAVGDTRLVIDVLPNRPDLLSHQGLAREIAAVTARPLHDAAIPGATIQSVPPLRRADRVGETAGVRVSVEDPGDAPAYLGVVIRGLHVGPSPAWLAARLTAVGIRPISNVVDATNYMLYGYGQPMHAFDLDRLAGKEVRVRRAAPGERLQTLDGVERVLDPEVVVIADAERAQGIAGVMGGTASAVSDTTTSIFLEIASFNPRRVRVARRALGVSTDASYRFERTVPATSPPATYQRAVQLILALAGGAVADVPVLVGATPPPPLEVTLRSSRLAQVLGVSLSAPECIALLAPLGFACARHANDLVVTVPSYRIDVLREIDLVEEVARLYGYDRIPDALRPFRIGVVPDDPLVAVEKRVRSTLIAFGCVELRPMPFVHDSGPGAVRVVNPLAEDEAFLRADLLSTLARSAEFNVRHMEANLRLFEVGTVFGKSQLGERPVEDVRVGALVMGARRPPHFTEPQPPAWDEWDAKWLGEVLARAAYPRSAVVLVPARPDEGGGDTLWHVLVDGHDSGRVARVPLDLPVAQRSAAPAFGVEITLQRVATEAGAEARATGGDGATAGRGEPRYRAAPSQPASWVDITLVVPDSMAASTVERSLLAAGDPLLERIELTREYRAAPIPPGYRSLTWRLTFRHPERTLVEKQVEARRDKLLQGLEATLGVRPRTT
jgi:phenylalanyl-tRNA synthetase beta chain